MTMTITMMIAKEEIDGCKGIFAAGIKKLRNDVTGFNEIQQIGIDKQIGQEGHVYRRNLRLFKDGDYVARATIVADYDLCYGRVVVAV